MPELPDICAYISALERRLCGRRLVEVAIRNPFFLRSVEPQLEDLLPRKAVSVQRVGKRVVVELDGHYWLVIHLMIAGRLQWQDDPEAPDRGNRNLLAVFTFDSGKLSVTEAGTKKRASLHVEHGKSALEKHDRGGLEVLDCNLNDFATRMRRENRTLKRALTDQRIISGIGNAYSDEILHAARLSPVTLTSRLADDEMRRLFDATQDILRAWRDRLMADTGAGFPGKVTAFRDGMAVHGRYRQPCPVCNTPIQRIRYASSETNYCPACQTGGRILADRSLSRLLKQDWPRTIEELDRL